MAFILQRVQAASSAIAAAEESQRDTMVFAQTQVLQRMLGATIVSVEDAATIQEVFLASSFPDDVSASLVQMIRVADPRGRQDFTAFSAYYTDEEWKMFPSFTVDALIQIACSRIAALGCRDASEPTAAQVTAFVLLCNTGSSVMAAQVPQEEKRVVLAAAKKSLNLVKDLAPPTAKIRVLPADPRDFQQRFADVYAVALNGRPHATRPTHSTITITNVASTIFMRLTRKRSADQIPQDALGGFLQAFYQHAQSNVPRHRDARIEILGPRPTAAIEHVPTQHVRTDALVASPSQRSPCWRSAVDAFNAPLVFTPPGHGTTTLPALEDAAAAPSSGVVAGGADGTARVDAAADQAGAAKPSDKKQADATPADATPAEDPVRKLDLALAKRAVARALKRPAAAAATGSVPPAKKLAPAKKPAASEGNRVNRVDHEKTRGQYLARTPEGSKAFKYGGGVSAKSAKAAAEAYVKRN